MRKHYEHSRIFAALSHSASTAQRCEPKWRLITRAQKCHRRKHASDIVTAVHSSSDTKAFYTPYESSKLLDALKVSGQICKGRNEKFAIQFETGASYPREERKRATAGRMCEEAARGGRGGGARKQRKTERHEHPLRVS